MFPVDGSHWINMKILLEELHARGHSLTVIRAETSWYIPEKSPLYTSITIKIVDAMEDFFEVFLQEHMRVCHHGLFIGAQCGSFNNSLGLRLQEFVVDSYLKSGLEP